jgi:hypothetical protein
VLQVVQSLGKLEFTLTDVYAHAAALAKLHPSSIPTSSFCFLVSSFQIIRQQLQVLRDLGLLSFLGSGSYRLC